VSRIAGTVAHGGTLMTSVLLAMSQDGTPKPQNVLGSGEANDP
jgi:hypothetical protein